MFPQDFCTLPNAIVLDIRVNTINVFGHLVRCVCVEGGHDLQGFRQEEQSLFTAHCGSVGRRGQTNLTPAFLELPQKTQLTAQLSLGKNLKAAQRRTKASAHR